MANEVNTEVDELEVEAMNAWEIEMKERSENAGTMESDKIDSELNNLLYQFNNDENFTGLEF